MKNLPIYNEQQCIVVALLENMKIRPLYDSFVSQIRPLFTASLHHVPDLASFSQLHVQDPATAGVPEHFYAWTQCLRVLKSWWRLSYFPHKWMDPKNIGNACLGASMTVHPYFKHCLNVNFTNQHTKVGVLFGTHILCIMGASENGFRKEMCFLPKWKLSMS